MQPIKELLSAAGQCAGRDCALIRQLANIRLRSLILELIYKNFPTNEKQSPHSCTHEKKLVETKVKTKQLV